MANSGCKPCCSEAFSLSLPPSLPLSLPPSLRLSLPLPLPLRPSLHSPLPQPPPQLRRMLPGEPEVEALIRWDSRAVLLVLRVGRLEDFRRLDLRHRSETKQRVVGTWLAA